MAEVITLDPENPFRLWLATSFHKKKHARVFAERARIAMPELEHHVVSFKGHMDRVKPPFRAPPGQLWCPYCNAHRPFREPAPGWYFRCIVCHMSDQDPFIKSANRLWNSEGKDYAEEAMTSKELERRDKKRARALKRRTKR